MAGHQVERGEALLLTGGPYHLDVGQPLQHLFDAVLFQRAHAVLESGCLDIGHGGARLDQVLDRRAIHQQFVHADAAAIAALVAVLAADRRLQCERSLAVGEAAFPVIEQCLFVWRRITDVLETLAILLY